MLMGMLTDAILAKIGMALFIFVFGYYAFGKRGLGFWSRLVWMALFVPAFVLFRAVLVGEAWPFASFKDYCAMALFVFLSTFILWRFPDWFWDKEGRWHGRKWQ